MKQTKTKIITTFIFSLILLGCLTVPKVKAQYLPTPTVSENSTLTIDGSQIWKVKVTQRYNHQTSQAINFPAPYAMYANDNRGFGALIENIKIFNDGELQDTVYSNFNSYAWLVEFSTPIKLGTVTIEYEVPAAVIQNFSRASVYFDFDYTKNALFTWVQGKDGVVATRYSCGIVTDDQPIARDECKTQGYTDIQFSAAPVHLLKSGEDLTVTLGFENEVNQTVIPPQQLSTVEQSQTAAALEDRRHPTIKWVWYMPLSMIIALVVLKIFQIRNKMVPLPVVAQYEPPKDLPVALAGFMVDNRVKASHLRAGLVEAILDKRVVFENSTDGGEPELHRVDNYDLSLADPLGRNIVLDALFKGSSNLKANTLFDTNNNSDTLSKYKIRTRTQLEFMGYIFPRYQKAAGAIGSASFVVLYFSGLLDESIQIEFAIAFIISAVLLVLCAFVLPMYKAKGQEIRRQLFGYKEFIDTAVASRVQSKTIDDIITSDERVAIPYAVLFGHKLEQYEYLDKYLPDDFWINYSNLEDSY